MEAKMSLSHAQTNTATLDQDIDVLLGNLTALHDMARSFPVGVTLPVEKRVEFDTLFDMVTAQFEHVADWMVASGIPVEAVLC